MLKVIFFALLTHLAIGALLPLLFISIEEIGIFFFRLMSVLSAVFLGIALWIHPFNNQIDLIPETVFGISSKMALLFIAFCISILIAGSVFIKRLGKTYLWAALAIGSFTLFVVALAYPVSSGQAQSSPWIRVTSFLGSAMLLGSVVTAMVTGHWYLVNRKLTIHPLKSATLLFLSAAVLRFIFVAGLIATLAFSAQKVVADTALTLLSFSGEGMIFWTRVGIGLIGPLVFGFMIYETVKLRSTQSATGILYATVVLVFIGEAFSKFLWFFTGVPV